MSRPPRLDCPGLIFHVMARGNNKQPVFQDRADYEFLEHLLGCGVARFGLALHAYCLMPNHVHFLLETVQGSLSDCLDWVLGRHARRFNWRHERVGHLFQGRFLAKIVANDAYLLEVWRYIHMNPVKAGLATAPESYRWSSMQAYLGGLAGVAVSTERIMEYFESETVIQEFTLKAGFLESPRKEWYLDSVPGVEPSVPAAPAPDSARVQRLLTEVAALFGLSVAELRGAWRNPRLGTARAIAMLGLRVEAGLTLEEICGVMAVKSKEAVCRTIAGLRRRLTRESNLQAVLDALGIRWRVA